MPQFGRSRIPEQTRMAGCSRLSSMLIHPAQTTGCDSVQPFGEPPVENNFASTLPVRASIPNLNVWQVVTTAILMSNGCNVSDSGRIIYINQGRKGWGRPERSLRSKRRRIADIAGAPAHLTSLHHFLRNDPDRECHAQDRLMVFRLLSDTY
jgi:hypothetical protein